MVKIAKEGVSEQSFYLLVEAVVASPSSSIPPASNKVAHSVLSSNSRIVVQVSLSSNYIYNYCLYRYLPFVIFFYNSRLGRNSLHKFVGFFFIYPFPFAIQVNFTSTNINISINLTIL